MKIRSLLLISFSFLTQCGHAKQKSLDFSDNGAKSQAGFSYLSAECKATACSSRISSNGNSPILCKLSSEGIALGQNGQQFSVLSKETNEVEFGASVPTDITLDFEDAISLLPSGGAPYSIVELSGQWLAACHSASQQVGLTEKNTTVGINPSDDFTNNPSNIDKDRYYTLGEAKGWDSQRLYLKENVKCYDNPSIPNTAERTIPKLQGIWLNRLKPNWYFVDANNTPWIYVSIPSTQPLSCFVKADRQNIVRENPAPPPPFKEFKTNCSFNFMTESGDSIQIQLRNLGVVAAQSEITISTSAYRPEMILIHKDPEGNTVFDSTLQDLNGTPIHLSSQAELPPGELLNLSIIHTIARIGDSYRHIPVHYTKDLYLAIENSRLNVANPQIPRMQLVFGRGNDLPPLMSQLSQCK